MAQKTVTLDISAVGLQFRLKREVRKILEGKTFKVSLEREADNQFDGNAVKVVMRDKKYGLLEGQHIGYLRRDVAAEIAPRIDSGQVKVISATMSDVEAETGDASLSVKVRKTA